MTTIMREQIIEAAAQIFREKGFHAASMKEIAKAVNLQKASLYHHVSSKQEMLVEILDQALDLLIERLQKVVEQPTSPEAKLRLAIQTYLVALADYSDLSAVMLLEHRSLEPEYHQRHIPRRDRFEALWRKILEDGVAEGVFDCPNPRLAVKSLMGVLNWTIMWYRRDGNLSAEEIAEQCSDLFLKGLIIRS
ncbi:MAG: TetR/AcrR family transcriptional regulator [Chloroflexi bacterium]|nr:TetR/AcrR family transcriptional regulator [Chloroflexota bacterium]